MDTRFRILYLQHMYLLALTLICVNSDVPVHYLKNETEITFKELNSSSLIIHVEPFDFVYFNDSLLLIETHFYFQHIQIMTKFSDHPVDHIEYLYDTKSLQLDWIGRNIYWIQSDTIEVGDVNGRYRKTIYWRNLNEPNTIVLDPIVRKIFWSDEGQNPKIEQAGMNGNESSRKNIINNNIQQPLGLAIDTDSEILYWGDVALQFIERCTYDGTNRVTLTQIGRFTPGVIAMHKEVIYFINQLDQSVNFIASNSNYTNSSNLIDMLPAELLRTKSWLNPGIWPAYRPLTYRHFHMRFLDMERINHENNVSKVTVGICHHLKLLSPEAPYYECHCSANFHFVNDMCIEDEDNVTAVVAFYDGILFCGNGTSELLHDTYTEQYVYLESENDVLFNSRFELYRASLFNISGTLSSILLSKETYPWEMQFDWLGRNVYISFVTAARYGKFAILNFQNGSGLLESRLFEFQHTFGYISTFELDPTRALMFMGLNTKLVRCSMDGDQRSIKELMVLENQRGHIVLSLDIINEHVFWSTHVQYVRTQGNSIVKLSYNGQMLPFEDHRIFTVGFIPYGDYMVINHLTVYGTQLWRCSKHYNGDCKEMCKVPRASFRTRVYPEIRETEMKYPCQYNNGNCSDVCLLSSIEPYFSCRCRLYYALGPDKRSCISLPCTIDNGNCSMTCKNIEGFGRRCGCEEGFVLASDNRTCTGEMGPILIIDNERGWQHIDMSSSTTKIVNTWLGFSVDAAAYDPIERKILWISESKIDKIFKSNLNGSDQKIMVDRIGLHSGQIKMVYDWLMKEVFWLIHFEIWKYQVNEMKKHNFEFHDQLTGVFTNNRNDSDIIDFGDAGDRFLSTGTFALDVFNGYVYVEWYRQSNNLVSLDSAGFLMEIIYFRSNFETHGYTKVIKHKDFTFWSTHLSVFALDYLNNKLYLTRNGQLMTYNIDASGKNSSYATIETILNLQHIVIFGDDMYFISQGSITKTNRKTLQSKVIERQFVSFRVPFALGVNLYNNNETGDEECGDYRKCWGINNIWKCLNQRQVCDGVIDCFEGHDEYYCNLCTDDCSLEQISFTCLEINKPYPNVEKDKIIDFVQWESQPVSHIISFESILSYDCTLFFQMKSGDPNQLKRYQIRSLYQLNRLRQVALSGILSTLSKVTRVYLFGIPFFDGLNPRGVAIFTKALYFTMENTYIRNLPPFMFNQTSSLLTLDLLHNSYLNRLDISCFDGLHNLKRLTITGSNIQTFDGSLFSQLHNLSLLNLSSNNIFLLGVGLLDNLQELKTFDIRNNDIQLTSNLFLFTSVLERIYCDSFTFCCIRPKSVSKENCSARQDDISSCSNLIAHRGLAAILWVFGILALIGNSSVIVYRGFVDMSLFSKSYFIFIHNLAVSDFLMAIYMLVIAVHDVLYDGTYVWNDYIWRKSTMCTVVGILSMISSEASMMFVSLITLERLFVVIFAFGEVRISRKHSGLICVAVWILAIMLAIFPATVYEDFFSRSGVCIAIPLTQGNETGIEYAAVVFLGLNFLFSIFILIGQVVIFVEVRKVGQRIQSTQQGRNLAVAKRLAVVVITDCLCWIPVGIFVIMSLRGYKLPRDIYAWVIIFILPLNAAVNPYLYTLTDLDKTKVVDKCRRREW